MTFAETFVQVLKYFGYIIWALGSMVLVFGPIISGFDKDDFKYPVQSFIIGLVSSLLFITFLVYKAQGLNY